MTTLWGHGRPRQLSDTLAWRCPPPGRVPQQPRLSSHAENPSPYPPSLREQAACSAACRSLAGTSSSRRVRGARPAQPHASMEAPRSRGGLSGVSAECTCRSSSR